MKLAALGALLLLAACAPLPTASPRPSPHYTGPIIDVHTHVVEDPNDPLAATGTRPLHLLAMRTAAITQSVVLPIAKQGELAKTRAMNDFTLQFARDNPGRIIPFASVHPDDGEAAFAELARAAQAGARGLKLHPNTQHFDVKSPAVAALVAKAAELKLPVLFDAYSPFDADEIGKFVQLAVSHPSAKLILAHMGGPHFPELIVFSILPKYGLPRNTWFDLSAAAAMYARSPFQEQLAFICRKLGIDRVLFGSDFPLFQPAESLDAVHALGFTPEEERQILYANAHALLGGDGDGGGSSTDAKEAGKAAVVH